MVCLRDLGPAGTENGQSRSRMHFEKMREFLREPNREATADSLEGSRAKKGSWLGLIWKPGNSLTNTKLSLCIRSSVSMSVYAWRGATGRALNEPQRVHSTRRAKEGW